MSLSPRLLLAVIPALLAVSSSDAATVVRNLRCEYKSNPIGIDVAQPRLGWWIESDVRGQVQTAYQVLVATSAEKVNAGQGDLWDSGEVKSDQSVHVVYGGKAPVSRQRCWWSVRIWDKNGKPTAWSEPAWWEMGLLRKEDWKASWIEHAAADEPSGGLQGGHWIWFPEGNPSASVPAGERLFRRSFEVPAGKKVARAEIVLTVDDQFALFVNGAPVHRFAEKDGWRKPQTVDIAKHLAAGKNVVGVVAVNEAPSPAGLLARIRVEIEGAAALSFPTDKEWKVSREKTAGWEKKEYDDSAWSAAKEVVPNGEGPWGSLGGAAGGLPPYFRRTFPVAKEIASARLYATALGLYEFRINGRRVGDSLLAPEWTNYHVRIQYQTYDVTALLQKGENAVGAILGDGWYCGHVGLGGRNRYGSRAALLGQIVVDFADGSSETIATDATWTASAGPLRQADLLDGTVYDARKEIPGWDRPGFNASAWKPAIVRDAASVKGALEAQVCPPVRKLAELPAKRINEPKPGAYTFDLGQNLVGWARLKVRAPAGTKVTLRFAEMLNPDGTVYVTNLRGARCIDEYVCKGAGEEVWEPAFTFHGFRYVEATGLPAKPGLDAIAGIVAGSDCPPTGAFECSKPEINQLQSNIVWGQRGNYLSVPTDCPQRDERCGWMGDAQVFIRTAAFNNEVASFFTKWLVDVDDAQTPAGAFPDIAPRVACGDATPAWADAGVICPWTVYLCYGDTRILERHYPAMVKWVEYCRKNSQDLIRTEKQGGSNYGDWLSIGANTPKDVLNTGYFGYSTSIVAKAAKVLGKKEDAEKYAQLFADIQKAFQQKFVDAEGRIRGNTQSCYLMGLRFNLLNPDQQKAAVKHLVEDIRKKGTHLSTGFVGVSYLLPTLTRYGQDDLAYALLNQDTFPGWLFSVKHGATTIWERWDGWTPERGFQDPGMNSFNHYSLGSCGEWMYERMLGIATDPERTGYKRIRLQARPGGGFTSAKGRLDSVHGRIASAWKVEGGTFAWELTVPPNTVATVAVPCGDPAKVRVGGKSSDATEGVRPLAVEEGASLFEVVAGTYAFTAPAPAN